MDHSVLRIEGLKIGINTDQATIPLIKGVDLSLQKDQITALVGLSGSGKTTIGYSILQLLPASMFIEEGRILLNGKDLLGLTPEGMRSRRGKNIGMVFQDPLSAFNPLFTIGFQIEESLRIHSTLTRPQRLDKVYHVLEKAGIPDPRRIAKSYPHQLSGGLRQRAMIAQAISVEPELLIADEPTSNLDVTMQARIIDLFSKLKNDLKVSILLITHDLGVVRALANRVAILSDGLIVESGEVNAILRHPEHRFTKELLKTVVA